MEIATFYRVIVEMVRENPHRKTRQKIKNEDVCWIQQLWSIRSRISAGKLSLKCFSVK